MLFVEARFLFFFALVFAGYWSLRSDRNRQLWLLLASYAFYAAWDWRFLSLIVASTSIDFVAGRCIGAGNRSNRRRAWLAGSVAANLAMLGFFKYFNFFIESAGQLLAWLGLPASPTTLSIVLPIGISFYTFQSMSYTIDVYRGRISIEPSPLRFALFVGFFPQLVAGPIVRARTFLPQLGRARRFSDVRVRACLLLFLSGFVKKACLADRLAVAVDRVFASPATFDTASHWLAAGLYHAQIYCDFSGYTEMALAAAGLLGYRLTANFDFPYLSRSVRGFWRRWHISLSTWFRDYLYISLGGNRGGGLRTARNLACVFLLCGLWHGASWTFVAWGLFHGALLTIERGGFGRWIELRSRLLGVAYVQLGVVLAWVLFRSPDLSSALAYWWRMAGLGEPGTRSLDARWAALLAALAGLHVLVYIGRRRIRIDSWPPWIFGLAYGAAVAVALPWIVTGHQPFIYFQF